MPLFSRARGNTERNQSSANGHTPRFGWSKLNGNPLFKISGRWTAESPLSNQHKKSPLTPSDSNSRRAKRTSSGGYFSTVSKDKPDVKFWAKLELEKKRKEMLKAISSRRFSERSLGNETSDQKEGDIQPDSKKEARQSLENARMDLERTLMFSSSNPLLDAGVDDDDVDGGRYDSLVLENERDVDEMSSSNPQLPNVNRWGTRSPDNSRQEMINTAVSSRLSNRSLDHIPEVSEHSERGTERRNNHSRDKPPNQVHKRYSSEELLPRAEGGSEIFESSNELTIRSNGSSIRTIKMSNRRTSSGNRLSNASGFSSEEVSLVSDTPMSDEDFLSASSSDYDSDLDFEEEDRGRAMGMQQLVDGEPPRRTKSGDARARQRGLRASMNELQRLSERSLEDHGASSSSFHIDTGTLLQEQNVIDNTLDESGITEYA